MKRVMCLVMIAAFAVGCRGSGGGEGIMAMKPHPRQSLLVLYQRGNSECQIKGASGIHAYRGDTVEWEVWNLCDGNHRVEVAFKTGTVPGSQHELSGDVLDNGPMKTLFLKVDAVPGSYDYALKVDGNTKVDPRLEIDP